MITFQRNWCISISNDNLTNLCHDRIVIFIIGHVFPPSYLSMRIHHVRGKVLQTGPKLQLTERMTDACAWLSLFLCRSARTPKLKINRENTQFLKERGWNRMLNGFYCENNKKKICSIRTWLWWALGSRVTWQTSLFVDSVTAIPKLWLIHSVGKEAPEKIETDLIYWSKCSLPKYKTVWK